MKYGLNSGYGQIMGQFPFSTGKIYVVGKDSIANKQMFKEMFKVDTDGVPRFYTTIDAAISLCTANANDRIYVMPGHTEILSSATALAADVAGVSIIGVGEGADRPTITLDTATTTTIPVSAANITFENIIFTANFADIVALFTLTTAKNFKLEGCYFKATASAMNFLNIIDTATTVSAANGLQIIGCKWIEPDTATLSLVKLDGDNSDIKIADNFLQLGVKNNTAAIMTVIDSSSAFNLQILNNIVYRLNTDTATGAILFHTDQSDNSGIIAGNFVQHADIAAELLLTATSGLGVFNNYASGVAGASGYILPAIDS